MHEIKTTVNCFQLGLHSIIETIDNWFQAGLHLHLLIFRGLRAHILEHFGVLGVNFGLIFFGDHLVPGFTQEGF